MVARSDPAEVALAVKKAMAGAVGLGHKRIAGADG